MNTVSVAPAQARVIRVVVTLLSLTVFGPASSIAILADEPAPQHIDQTPSTTLASISHLPASNPYREALKRWLSLPAADRSALLDWADSEKTIGSDSSKSPATITAEQRKIVSELNATMRLAATYPDAAQWPIVLNREDPKNLLLVRVEHLTPVMALGQFLIASNARAATGEAVANYLALAQFARQAREGPTIVEQLSGIALEKAVITQLARRLNEFSATELAKISKDWPALRPTHPIAEVLGRERDHFFKPTLDGILVPGLTALIAEKNLTDKSSLDASSREAIAMLRRYVSSAVQFDAATTENETNSMVSALLILAEYNKKGVRGYRDETLAEYDAFFASSLERARSVHAPNIATRLVITDPLSALVVAEFETVGRSFIIADITSQMFEAAVSVRLEQLGGKAFRVPLDASSPAGSRFGYEKTEDGGFILGSVFETRDGRPLKFKYGAPDAGPIR